MLDKISDSFTYKLEYQFDENIDSYDTVQLEERLENVLELKDRTGNLSIETEGMSNFDFDVNYLNNRSGFMIDIPKQNNTYNYLAGRKIIITFQAKIKDDVTKADLENYSEKNIPNETTLLLDNDSITSNTVYVKPPKDGTIKIVKVDAKDEQIKLSDAKFEIRDSNGKKVDDITTDSDGIGLSKELPAGEYTIVEIDPPLGYEI